MKSLRLFLIWLGVLVALAAVLVGILFTSPLQTWLAQTVLDRQPGWKSSVGDIWAGFGRLKVTDLHVETNNGAVLSLPALQARLPLRQAVWDHRFVVQSLVAKGWTLDLSNLSAAEDVPSAAPAAGAPKPAPADAASASGSDAAPTQLAATLVQNIEQIFHGIIGGWKSPYDLSLDGVDLEGDVIVNVSLDRAPIKVHVRMKGGGLAAGHEGTFAIDAESENPWPDLNSVAAHGQFVAGMNSPRTFSRAEIKADVVAQGRMFPSDFAVSVDLDANHRDRETQVTLNVIRDRRHLASVDARISAADSRVRAEWKFDVKATDVTPFMPQLALPQLIVLDGGGQFDSDLAFTQVHVLGAVEAGFDHLEQLAPALAPVGNVGFAAKFDLTAHARTWRIATLDVLIASTRPVVTVHALQPFDFTMDAGSLQLTDPARDGLNVVVEGLPLEWFSALTGKFAVTGGDATGEFVLRQEKTGWSLRPRKPLTATGIAVERAGGTLGQNLDLSLLLSADFGTDGWQMKLAPLTVSSAGARLANLTAAITRAGGGDKPVTVAGTWTADLDALAMQPGLTNFAGTSARSAGGEFNATVDHGLIVDGKVNVVGHDAAHAMSATVHLDSSSEGTVEFQIPVTVTLGKKSSVFSAEGAWSGGDAGVRLNGRLTGDDVDLDHLRLLAAPVAAAMGLPHLLTLGAETVTPAAATIVSDPKPFWLGWFGEVTFAFGHLRSGTKDYPNVGATLDVDETSITLKRAWMGDTPGNPAQVEGALSFDATSKSAYRLKVVTTVNDLDVAPILNRGRAKADTDLQPVLEGHFSVTTVVKGEGRNFGDLIRHTQEDYQATSKGGIIRLLKTSVGDSLPAETPGSAVGEAAGTVGSWVGWLAGVDKNSVTSGEKKVGKNTDAILNLTSQIDEIGYDQINVTATQTADGAIHLAAIEILSRDARLTGSGEVASAPALPLAARPLAMDLHLGFRGNLAALLSQTSLLTKKNDDLGYLQFVRPVHFGGTLRAPDVTDWHDLLAGAAMPVTPAKPLKK